MSNNAMSKETDLDWLARNVHKWHEQANMIIGMIGSNHYFWSQTHSKFPNTTFTKSQWLSRRAELQNKPSWKDAPEWATHLSQGESGVWRFMTEPHKTWLTGCTWHEKMEASTIGLVLGDWRDTLEKRPEEFQPFTSLEDNQEKAMKQDGGWFERGELPPVGARCVALLGIAPKANCEVIAKTEQQMVVKWEENGMMDVIDIDEHTAFRPIRTERDKLVELIKTYRHTLRSDTEFADAILAAGFSLGAK